MRLYCTAGQGPYLGKLPVLALLTSIISITSRLSQRQPTHSCDDTPTWRETLAVHEEEETVPDETATDIIAAWSKQCTQYVPLFSDVLSRALLGLQRCDRLARY